MTLANSSNNINCISVWMSEYRVKQVVVEFMVGIYHFGSNVLKKRNHEYEIKHSVVTL